MPRALFNQCGKAEEVEIDYGPVVTLNYILFHACHCRSEEEIKVQTLRACRMERFADAMVQTQQRG